KAYSLLRQIYRPRQGCNQADRARDHQGSTRQPLETARYDIVPQDPHSGAQSRESVPVSDKSEVYTEESCISRHRQIRPDQKPLGQASSWRCSNRFLETRGVTGDLFSSPDQWRLENPCCRSFRIETVLTS